MPPTALLATALALACACGGTGSVATPSSPSGGPAPHGAAPPTARETPAAAREDTPENPALASWHFLRAKYDGDGDGRITGGEYTRSAAGFTRLDADRDGLVTVLDFDPRWDGVPRVDGAFRYGVGGPEVGEPAPEFELSTTDGRSLSLAELRAERPVVLAFGSFT
jgi:hypothetical protein